MQVAGKEFSSFALKTIVDGVNTAGGTVLRTALSIAVFGASIDRRLLL
jgi:hypothetical protein